MQRLLLVDDEPYLVDGLLDYLREMLEDIEFFGAYSAPEALEVLRTHKIDVVITDVSMPGMTGIELLQQIKGRWPRCKVILLSVFDSFDYAQSAIRGGSFNYILKTEGDEKVLETVRQAFGELEEENRTGEYLAKADAQRRQALPLLQNELLRSLLLGGRTAANERFASVELELRTDRLAHLVVGKVDHWEDTMSMSDRSLLLFALNNIAHEHLDSQHTSFHEATVDGHFCWIISLKENSGQLLPKDHEPVWTGQWDDAVHFVQYTLESIQEMCRKLLRITVSLVMASEPVPWAAAPAKYDQLLSLLRRGFGLSAELLLTERGLEQEGDKTASEHLLAETQSRLKRIGRLETLFDSGQKRELLLLYDDIAAGALASANALLCMEVYTCFYYQLLSYMNRWNLSSLYAQTPLQSGFSLLPDQNWTEMFRELRALFERMIDHETNEQAARMGDVVTKIRRHIELNMAGDLSLTRLGELVRLNPTYLSRLYKQLTGQGLNDYVIEARMNKAAALLANPKLRIQDIVEEVGYASASYFTRYFKKATGLTPHEYRDRILDNQS